jgi:hypothetical protein
MVVGVWGDGVWKSQVQKSAFSTWPGLKMKSTKGAVGESSRKKRKVNEEEVEAKDEEMSPVTADSKRRDEYTEKRLRKEYSSELGEESPQRGRDWRAPSRPREGGFRSRDFPRRGRDVDGHYQHRRRDDPYDRDDQGRYRKDYSRQSHSPVRYTWGREEALDDRYRGSRGVGDRFRESLSPPLLAREHRGRGRHQYDSRLERSPPASTSRALRPYQEMDEEKEALNRVQLDL